MITVTTAATQLEERKVRVEVGPAGGTGLAFEDEDLIFKVKATRGQKPNEAEVAISNLSQATIETYLEANGIQAADLVLQVYAGSPVLGLLFRGSVARRGIETAYDIPERTTTIRAADGRRVWRDTRFSASWPPGSAVAAAFQELIKASNLPIGYSSALPGDTFAGTWSFAGRWERALTQLCVAYGLTWWIDQGALYLVNSTDDPSRGNAVFVSPGTGLIGSPKRTDKGCDFEMLLEPKLRPGWPVVIASDYFDGLYRPINIEHSGATEARSWVSRVQTELVK